jgi:hypothetical protein
MKLGKGKKRMCNHSKVKKNLWSDSQTMSTLSLVKLAGHVDQSLPDTETGREKEE